MTAIYDYRQHPSSVSCPPCYSESISATMYTQEAHHKRPKTKQGLTVRKVMKKLLANRLGRFLRPKDTKPSKDSESTDGFRQRTLSENSNPASILSDYDPMPTISEESDDEVVAYFFELMQSGGCYWDDDDYEFDGDAKPSEDSELANGFRQRTLSENSNPASILSDYDPMPTISEESDDEVVAYFFELMQSGGCYWDDDDYEFDGGRYGGDGH